MCLENETKNCRQSNSLRRIDWYYETKIHFKKIIVNSGQTVLHIINAPRKNKG